jgi:spore germination protein KC
MPRKWLCLLLVICLSSGLTSGCWDRAEVEEIAFVVALGLDKGEKAPYSVTAAIAIPQKMAGGDKGGEGDPIMLTTVEAPTIAGGLAIINSYVSRRVSLLQTKALFMGEELAKESGMEGIDELVRFRQARRTIYYLVTEGKAAKFLGEMKTEMEKDPHRFIEQLTYAHRYTGMIPRESQIQTFVSSANTGYASPITYYVALKEEKEEQEEKRAAGFYAGSLPRKGGPNIEMVGGAAFRRRKLVGLLSGDEMRLVSMLRDEFRSGHFSFPDPKDPDRYISAEMHRGRPLVMSVDLTGDRPLFRGLVTLEAELLSIQSLTDYTEPALQPVLEGEMAAALEQAIRELFTKSQAWRSDLFGLGRHLVKRFPTVEAWDRFNWVETYPEAKIDIQVNLKLRRFGLQLSPPQTER